MTAATPGSAALLALADELHSFCAAAPHDYPGHNIALFEKAEAAIRLAANPDEDGVREAIKRIKGIALLASKAQNAAVFHEIISAADAALSTTGHSKT